jgi:c-di-GMP-binding flagellar brake protein YcgR
MMNLFEKGLPLCLIVNCSNGQTFKYMLSLKGSTEIGFFLESPLDLSIPQDANLSIEILLKNYILHFSTTLLEYKSKMQIYISKPVEIHKKKLRDSPRIFYETDTKFSIWPDNSKYSGKVRDISDSGFRMTSMKLLRKGQVISVDLYFKEPKIRAIGQGAVVWTRYFENYTDLFEMAIKFTTVSNEVRHRLSKYIEGRAILEKTTTGL